MMREVSVITLLQQQREKNEKAYQALFGSLNLSGIPNFQTLPQTSLAGHQALINAGFQPTSLVDRLSGTDLKLLLHLAKLDVSRLYLEEDIKHVADRYGLKMLSSNHYKGDHQERLAIDLKDFQAQLQQEDMDCYFDAASMRYRYHLLGTTAYLSGHTSSTKRLPLIFVNIGNEVYYLISRYDCWVPSIRRIIYFPLARPSISVPAGLLLELLVAIFSSHLIWLLGIDIIILMYFMMGLLHFSWTMPTALPTWLGKVLYRITP